MIAAGILAIAIASVGWADPSEAEELRCPAATPEQARWIADQLYRQGEYQRAGGCYQSAGDLADANEAFVKAVPAKSGAAAKDLKHQSQKAKALFTGLQQAFRANH
jgi:hypothetical protein